MYYFFHKETIIDIGFWMMMPGYVYTWLYVVPDNSICNDAAQNNDTLKS